MEGAGDDPRRQIALVHGCAHRPIAGGRRRADRHVRHAPRQDVTREHLPRSERARRQHVDLAGKRQVREERRRHARRRIHRAFEERARRDVPVTLDDRDDGSRVLEDAALDMAEPKRCFVMRMIVARDRRVRGRFGGVRLIGERAFRQAESGGHDRSRRNGGRRRAGCRHRAVQPAELETLQSGQEAADAHGRARRTEEPGPVRLECVVAARQRVDGEKSRGIGDHCHSDRAKRRNHGAGNRPTMVVADHAGDAPAEVPDGLVLERLGLRRRGAENSNRTDRGNRGEHPDARLLALHSLPPSSAQSRRVNNRCAQGSDPTVKSTSRETDFPDKRSITCTSSR